MLRLLPFYLCAVLFVVSPVSARTEFRLGGADGVPWQEILSQGTAGAYLVLDEEGRPVDSVPVVTAPQSTGVDTLIDFSGSSIQPLFIDPMVNLARGEPDNPDDINKVYLPYTGGEVSVPYGCRDSAQNAPLNWLMLDGKPATAQFRGFTQHPDRAPGIPLGNAFLQAIIFDLGANVPINRIRFYPRLDREEDALLIQSFADPKPSPERFGEDSFADNFVAWFEIRVGDNSLPYQNGPCGRVPGRRWISNDDPLKPGNATFRFSGDVLAVNTPVGGDLLVDVAVVPHPFTPNGDGVNDLLRFSYKLREVVVDRPISVRIYDLAGRMVAELPPRPSRSGEFHQAWDGRDAAGRRVPPGTYLYKLVLDVEDEQNRMGFFSVVY